MERHQAGQEDRLVEISVDPPSGGLPPARRPFSHTKALVVAMAVIALGLVLAGFTFYFVKFAPLCVKDAASLEDAEGINIMSRLTETDKEGSYDVFTAKASGKYLIYGWVNLTNIQNQKVLLRITFNGNSMTLEEKDVGEEVFFFQKVVLMHGSRISLYFNASCTGSLFHIHKV